MQKHIGSCHCGEVKYEATGDFSEVISCNCSMCRRKGTLLAFVPAENFKMLSGAEELVDYQFGKKRIHDTFCGECGVTPFAHGMAPNSSHKMFAINVRCFDDIDLDSLKVKKVDGKSFPI
ncbi:GFA family protein [Bdellovibrio sp. SKB1291214]|uniref:GFA family protein n=1 Tax=Bdellovibrio sp. SKB1291214 TaxID=1732569 RepID=UPI000B519B64|nr:GFA family protein [Bdellovibrio sp. SKB1291214]UYL10269.1 GFA family protein [Bdellovibrio sp. SKB1291214]